MMMPTRNNEGFLEDAWAWSPDVALEIAAGDNIELTDNHWEIIGFLRKFYKQHEVSPPSNRLFVKAVREAFDEEKGNSIYLHLLFPDGPAKQATKIAGLPKPARCI